MTSYELLPKFKTMLKDCPKVHTLIVMEDQLNTIDATGMGLLIRKSFDCITFCLKYIPVIFNCVAAQINAK